MAAGVEASISVSVRTRQIGAADLGTPQFSANVEKLVQFIAGTANDGQANALFTDKRTLASATSENLDMTGALTDALGATLAQAEIVALYVEADAANTTDLTVGGAASNAFNGPLSGTTPGIVLKPGDFALLTSKDGWPVTAGTGDLLKVANASGAAADYKIVAIGRTAAT